MGLVTYEEAVRGQGTNSGMGEYLGQSTVG